MRSFIATLFVAGALAIKLSETGTEPRACEALIQGCIGEDTTTGPPASGASGATPPPPATGASGATPPPPATGASGATPPTSGASGATPPPPPTQPTADTHQHPPIPPTATTGTAPPPSGETATIAATAELNIEAAAEHATEAAATDLAGTAAGDAAASGASAISGEMDSTIAHPPASGSTLDWTAPTWVEPTWEEVESDGVVTRTSSDGQTEVIRADGSTEWSDAHGNKNYYIPADEEGVEMGGYESEWGGGSWTSGTDEDGEYWHESSWWDSEGNGGGSNRDWSSYEYTAAGLWGEMDSEGNWMIFTADGDM